PGGRYPPPCRRGVRTFLVPASPKLGGDATARPSDPRGTWSGRAARSTFRHIFARQWSRDHIGAFGGWSDGRAMGAMVGTMKGDRAPGEPVRLLLVEDEALIALMLEDMVEGIGCAVTGLAPRVALGVAMAETG